MNFSELKIKKEVLDAIGKLGFETPSKIQAAAIPFIIDGSDVVGQAETGTGKTLAFGAGILSRMSDNNKVKALILTPTRELAIQIGAEIETLSIYTNAKILTVYGNSSIEKQMTALKGKVDIVVGTPGRVMDLMKRRKLNVDHLEFFVLDEADEMLNMGFREDIDEIYRKTKQEKQVLLFSATMEKEILKLAKKYMSDTFEKISVVTNIKTAKNIVQKYYVVNEKMRTEAMCRVMDQLNPKKAMIFCKTKRNVDQLYNELYARGYSVGAIHGDVIQSERINTLDKFKKGLFNYLVATDVAARGIHVDDIEVVLNYNLPQDNESYVHRIGRTGRANKSGIALTFVTPAEEKVISSIKRHIQTDITLASIPTLEDIVPARCEDIITSLNSENITINKAFDEYLQTLNKMEMMDICQYLLNKELMNSLGSDFTKNVEAVAKKRRTTKGKSENETRLFLTIGKTDGIDKKSLLTFLEKTASLPKGALTSTEVLTKFTFLNIDTKYLDKFMKKCNNVKMKKRVIKIEVAN